jgi:hypothetical protein
LWWLPYALNQSFAFIREDVLVFLWMQDFLKMTFFKQFRVYFPSIGETTNRLHLQLAYTQPGSRMQTHLRTYKGCCPVHFENGVHV